ncbi:SUMF1/EgtB/PvdO family nonheme iron enzyme [Dactylosporangium siamense]|uniref:SUMF1/EgtB/PvdO family nonheme iron enzyme n=1 Tax=Dactylosporangium siamense TaxID=685454 RepID=A0A919PPE4_9ACTN|nr:SUMF1/EgtB/PvdO family nonheme iron enzyme [Dactylosporangium siamense]GIG47684.1 hypothetical protein Dsi01nite_057250 [Dactylosporangium siamense]
MSRDLSQSRAILIGASEYRDDRIPDLPAAGASLRAMEALLTGQWCGWPGDRVTVIAEPGSPSELASQLVATVRNIRDTVLLYYVGHGLRTSEGQLALAVRNTEAAAESLPYTALLYEAVAKILRGCPALTKLIILDCCHAELGTRSNFHFQSGDLLEAYPVDGLYFVGASRIHMKAKAPLNAEPTHFTRALVDVVNEGIPGRPATLRLDQVFVELRSRLLRADLPEPVESGLRSAHRFPFAINAAPPISYVDPERDMERVTALVDGGAAGLAGVSVQDLVQEYLNDLIRSTSTLAFGDPVASTGDDGGVVTLEQVWTPLRVVDSQALSADGPMVGLTDGTDLGELLDATSDSVVILSDPGGGKSTSVSAIALKQARRHLTTGGTLPIRVRLGSVVASETGDPTLLLLSGVPEVQLCIARDGRGAGAALVAYLRSKVQRGAALLLLDGLDEVGEALIGSVRRAISQIVLPANGIRVIVTCRKFDYRQNRPPRKVAISRELELLPYTRIERNRYVQQWYRAAVQVGRFESAEGDRLAAGLKQELLNPELAELAGLPLLLTLLTLIHSEAGRLPEVRAVVCDTAIRHLLAGKAKWRTVGDNDTAVAASALFALAQRCAHFIHSAEENVEGTLEIGLTRLDIAAEAEALCTEFARLGGRPTDPEQLTSQLLRSHGLLAEIAPGRYRFAHRYFQEFLAGHYYANGARADDALRVAREPHWREPFRLMAGFAGHEGADIFYVLTLVGDLLDIGRPDAASVASSQLAAEMLTEIGVERLTTLGFGRVLAPDADGRGMEGLWRRAEDTVARQVENERLTLAERFRAASVVAHLGDRRFVTVGGDTRPPWKDLVVIPAGPAAMGSRRLDSERTLAAGTREVVFPAFGIGRYLVTNSQYARFLEDGGYAEPAYWPGRYATGWVGGDPGVLAELGEHWLETVHEHHAKELRDGEILVDDLRAEAVIRIGTRLRPFYWGDRRFNQPNQPVVGINYWEASAYCAWATENGHRTGTLPEDAIISVPTEFEWERACRPSEDDRIYPWGDDEADEKSHLRSNVLNIRQPSPVGIYLPSWDGGPFDLGGNVWEWTSSLNRPYAAVHDVTRDAFDSLDEHIVRGSSWYNTFEFAACSSRAVDRSYNLFYDVGCRIVVVSASADRPGAPPTE